MENTLIYDSDLHFEHKQWEGELDFWKDELKTFKNRLSELIGKYEDQKVLAKLEHFQNEFILHGSVIEELEETIEEHESNMAEHSKVGEEALDVSLVERHLEFRQKMETQRQIYADLKKQFYQFLTEYWT
ncbi:MAG: hypothetical protein CBB72_001120 [Muricauda sp. TMED12]|jgi:predicted ATP-grasp superfamily ATP-dependent carboligase|nr:MAG: hypothetical protein CBB72_001120 [Muricauda sp. TMED12]|tara:strand:- start:1820 stop:2209 length:390 start_codon:yes stop_codon:yes gene_type:complete